MYIFLEPFSTPNPALVPIIIFSVAFINVHPDSFPMHTLFFTFPYEFMSSPLINSSEMT